MKQNPIKWAQEAVKLHSWRHAHKVAKECFHILPMDSFWQQAYKWLDKRTPEGDKK